MLVRVVIVEVLKFAPMGVRPGHCAGAQPSSVAAAVSGSASLRGCPVSLLGAGRTSEKEGSVTEKRERRKCLPR